MKYSVRITFCTAAALALLLMPQPSAAEDNGQMNLEDVTLRACKVAPETPLLESLSDEKQPKLPVKIEDGPCFLVCGPNARCSLGCFDDNDNWTDCGDYGACDPCREGIVEIGRELIGNQAARKWLTQCQYRKYFNVTYQSQNPGCTAFTQCEEEIHTEGPILVPCCAIVPGCFGVSSCP